ncbi:hypothetical protein EDD28_2214 [Salana multivorans]|uniref:Uncharacterized protein n=2 Tax=Salana multivorans TaxID=120377 RepID=A0A3N2DCW1_9MICO|nr:hypothetical protein EDD28_2214 [Salana multivorans]
MRLQASAGNGAVATLVRSSGVRASIGAGAVGSVGVGPLGVGPVAAAGRATTASAPAASGRDAAGVAGAVGPAAAQEGATTTGTPTAGAVSGVPAAASQTPASASTPAGPASATPEPTAAQPVTAVGPTETSAGAVPGGAAPASDAAREGPVPADPAAATGPTEGASTATTDESSAGPALAATEVAATPGAAESASEAAGAATPTRSAASSPGLARAKARVAGAARTLKQHGAPAAAGAAGVRAAAAPSGEREAIAKAGQADDMAAAEPRPFDRAAFIAAVHQAIAQQQPRTLEEADAQSRPDPAVATSVRQTVAAGQTQAAAPVAEATTAAPSTSQVPVEEPERLAPPVVVPAPAIHAAEAVPQPLPAEQTNLAAGPAAVSDQMARANVTEEQLARSNEPELTGALDAKRAGEAHSATAPGEVRAEEATVLAGARAGAEAAGAQASVAMVGARDTGLAAAHTSQGGAADRTAQMRARVTGRIHAIFDATRTTVEGILAGIGPSVEQQFVAGEQAAAQAFQNHHDQEMAAFRDRRYGGALGWTDWIADKLTSPPPEVNRIIESSRALYTARMTALVEQIADTVSAELGRASAAVQAGRAQIAEFVASRPAQERQVAQQAATEVGTGFTQLETSIDEKATALADDLAARYVEASAAVDERVTAMREANRGLIDRARDAVGGAITTILKMKDMLTGVLARAAGAVDQIIQDPIGFLGNFVGAIRAGVGQFVGNIATHLKRGLQEWLFGALAEAGIEVPETLDLKGVITLVLQLIGATWANLRARIVKRIGERAMAAVERGVEVIQLLVTKGIGGLWEWIAGKVTNLYEQVVEKIQDFVVTKVITAGVTWLISLLNPAAAFIKACRMIYDAVMWFVENAARLKDFVGSVLDSVESIARGGVGAVASLIENTMARTVPMIISGFASLLGLGGIAAKIKSILQTVQRPVGKLIDKVVDTAVRFGKRAMGRLTRGGRSRGPGARDDGALGPALRAARALLARPGATPETVRAALPGLTSEHGLRAASLQETSGRFHIHVQREDGDTPAVALGGGDHTDLVGRRVFVAAEKKIAKVVKIVTEHGFAMLQWDTGRAGPRSRNGPASFGVKADLLAEQLRAGGPAYTLATGNENQTTYTIDGENLRETYDGLTIRNVFYGGTNAYLHHLPAKLAPLRNPDGLTFRCPGTGSRPAHDAALTSATLDHAQSLAVHWKTHGHNATQRERVEFSGQSENLVVLCRSCNSSKGSGGVTYVRVIGVAFTGPNGDR